MSATAPVISSAVPTAPKPRPYRRYLTFALHTRFVHAVFLAFLNSLLITFGTGKDYFWSWFPLGPAGLKAALFTTSSLIVFILQLATLSVGRRTSSSTITTIRATILDTSSYKILFGYVFSAWWFCEAYIWAVPESHSMGWVMRGGLSSPDRLNERPIYLRFFFTVIAVVQSGMHLYYGQSYLHVPVAKMPLPQSTEQQTHPVESVQKQLQRKLPMILMRSCIASGLSTVAAPFVYKAFFREYFWKIHLAFAKPFFNLPRSDAHPPQTYFIGSILGWAFFVGMAMSSTWEVAAHSFLIYLRQSPLKNGLPLSALSRDPNGSLLNGLRAKKSVVKTFALWELTLIAQKFPDRRKAIFNDFERSEGPMWTSMMKAVLSVLQDVDSRITALLPPPPQPQSQSQEQSKVNTLPRIARDADSSSVLAPAPPPSTRIQKVENFLAINKGAIALGKSKNAWSPPIRQTQQKFIEYAKPTIGPASNDLRESVRKVLSTGVVGNLISTRPAKKISSIILGSPAGNAAIVVDSIESITKMLVASLNEDSYGKVAQTVPETVKQFAKTVTMIEKLVSAHSDYLTPHDQYELEEISIIVDRLKAGLRELLAAFQVFLNDAGLGIKDLNEAKRASEDRPLIPKKQKAPVGEPITQKPEMEEPGQNQHRNLSGRGADSQELRERRARETAQSLRRIELQPKRGRASGAETNVFGARDFTTTANRSARVVEMVR